MFLRYLAGGGALVCLHAGKIEYCADSIIGLTCDLHADLTCNTVIFICYRDFIVQSGTLQVMEVIDEI